MVAESVRSRAALATLLRQIRDPLRNSDLYAISRSAAALCSTVFEKAYLAKLAGAICDAPQTATEWTGLAAELFMFAALTVDDWLDETGVRAGKPTIHVQYGIDKAILAANCLTELAHLALSKAADEVPSPLRVSFYDSFRAAILALYAGQANIVDLTGTHVSSLPTVDRLARQRCGYLIASAFGAAAYLSDRLDLLSPLLEAGTWLGIALQHRNDIQDFTVAFEQNVKPPLADLLNGQPNLVVCFLLKQLPQMKPKERALLTRLHGRNRDGKGRPLKGLEFRAILELSIKYQAAASAARHVAACTRRCRNALETVAQPAYLDHICDYLQLVQQP